MLRLYGKDPDKIRAEIEESKLKMKEINESFDTKFKPEFAELWRKFIEQYKTKLGATSDD